MSLSVLCVLQQDVSTTGQIGLALKQLGVRVLTVRPLLGQRIPRNLSRLDGLIVFGGPMSANDDYLSGIRYELVLIEQWLKIERPIWGICLGAQLMARVFGAKVFPHAGARVEIGWYPLELIGFGHRIFAPLRFVYQWHREGYELPSGATRLAKGIPSAAFDEQSYLIGKNGFATQFHPEINPKMMQRWLGRSGHMLSLLGARNSFEHNREMRSQFPKQEKWLKKTLVSWLRGELRDRSKNFCFQSIPACIDSVDD